MKRKLIFSLITLLIGLCYACNTFAQAVVDYNTEKRFNAKHTVFGKVTALDSTKNYTWVDFEGDTSNHWGIRFPHIKDTAHAPKVPGVYFENYADGRALWYWDPADAIFKKAGLPSYSDTTEAPKVSGTYIINQHDSLRLYYYAYGKWRKAGS